MSRTGLRTGRSSSDDFECADGRRRRVFYVCHDRWQYMEYEVLLDGGSLGFVLRNRWRRARTWSAKSWGLPGVEFPALRRADDFGTRRAAGAWLLEQAGHPVGCSHDPKADSPAEKNLKKS